MNNWFSVGEQVFLVSESQAQHNGEYVINEIISRQLYEISKGIVEDGVAVDLGFVADKGNQYWDIKSIRKKYKPSSEDFQSMMDTLKTNIVEPVS